MGKADEHLTQLEALVALDPGPARSVALGLAYSRVGLTDRAIPTLRQASERYPEDAYLSAALGRVWLEAGETGDDPVALGKAREALERGVARDDNTSEALTLFGRALLLASDHVLAERVLQDATRREPIDSAAFFHLAEAAERCGHLELARQALLNHRTLAGDDRDPRRRAAVAERIGTISMRLGHPQAAAVWYRRAIEEGAADLAVLVKLAGAEAATGDPQAARRTIATALERDPDDAGARALLRTLR
jgi:predicted Zn-dependent protease